LLSNIGRCLDPVSLLLAIVSCKVREWLSLLLVVSIALLRVAFVIALVVVALLLITLVAFVVPLSSIGIPIGLHELKAFSILHG
jgi:hypothetical protein